MEHEEFVWRIKAVCPQAVSSTEWPISPVSAIIPWAPAWLTCSRLPVASILVGDLLSQLVQTTAHML